MPIGDNENEANFFFSTDGVTFHPIGEIVGDITLSNEPIQNPKCVFTSAEEFTATGTLSEEDSATVWAVCEGLEIVPREDNNG